MPLRLSPPREPAPRVRAPDLDERERLHRRALGDMQAALRTGLDLLRGAQAGRELGAEGRRLQV